MKNFNLQKTSISFFTFIAIGIILTISPINLEAQNTLDTSFSGGVTENTPQGRVSARQADGKILVGGGFRTAGGTVVQGFARLNSDGSFDTTFNSGGSGLNLNSALWDIKILPDGKILIGGSFASYNGTAVGSLARLNADGTLDTTFNVGGTGTNNIQTIFVQTDGKILISGISIYNGTTINRLARLNTDGSLDTSFLSRFPANAFVEGLAVDPDGKIVAGGTFSMYDSVSVPQGLIRLNTDGTRDTTFNNGGVGLGGSGLIYGIARQTDGKYVITGSFGNYNAINRLGIARINADGSIDLGFTLPALTFSTGEFVEIMTDGKILLAGLFQPTTTLSGLMRLNADGSLDTGFQLLPIDNTGYHNQTGADGKIVLTGYFNTFNNQDRSGIVRLNANGSLDSSFNASLNDTSAIVSRLVQQQNGKILAAGSYSKANGVINRNLTRFNLDGTIDTSFNIGTGTAPGSSGNNSIESLAVQTDGKVLIGGIFSSYNGTLRASLARLNADGSLDTTFDPSFIFRFTLNVVYDIFPQTDGKILIGGSIFETATTRRFLYRLNSNGTVDTTFNTGGAGPNSVVRRIIRQTDGKTIIVGQFTNYNGTAINRVARLNTDGTLDTTFNVGTGADSTVLDATLQTDGKIIIAGQFANFNGTSRNDIARLNADGSLDTTFNTGTGSNGFIYSVRILPTGKIMAGGTFSDFNGTPTNRLVRLNTDGSVDTSFISGFSTTAESVRAILPQFDGKALLGGKFDAYSGNTRNSLARLFTPEIGGGTQPILFSSNRDGNSEIYKMNADGTNQQRLTDSPEGEGNAKWSPNGTKIFFSKTINSTQTQIWIMNPDGSNKTLISDATGINFAYDWSPNGLKILFAKKESSAVENLWTMNADGSNKLQLTNAGTIDHIVSWSPDSSKIAFGRCNPSFVCDVFTMNADGTNQTNLTPTNPNDDDGPQWTNDGSRIVFGSQNTPNDYNVYIMNANGTNRQQLTTAVSPQSYSPQLISPSGNKIAMDFRGGGATTFEIFTSNLDGSNLMNLTNNSAYDAFRFWSPDSSKIAFLSRRDTPTDEIYTMTADGSNVVRLTFNSASDFISDWRRDAVKRAPFDFDGDGKTDLSIFRPAPGEWWINRSSNGSTFATQFGITSDKIVPADYTGDGKTDVAFWRPSTGQWFVLRSEDLSFFAVPFGTSGDVPVPADYDGDGKADFAVFRPSSLTWFIEKSSGGTDIIGFGAAGDKPVVGDYDGDGKADIAIFRPNGGIGAEWWIRRSSNGGVFATQFGAATDKPVQGDFTGDGKTDIAVWRSSNGNWFVLRSEDFSFFAFPFGTTGDIPVAGDYDGDGRFDAGVFRPSSNNWFVQRSTAGTLIQQFGINGDLPLPNSFVP